MGRTVTNKALNVHMENNQGLSNSIVIYQTNDGETCIDVKFQDETVWPSQAQMAELFQKDRTVIGRHISNIFKEGELEESLVCAKFAHAKEYNVVHILADILLCGTIYFLQLILYLSQILICKTYSHTSYSYRHDIILFYILRS